jgi:DNA invertase Pin-like site-specific DNA recombinase
MTDIESQLSPRAKLAWEQLDGKTRKVIRKWNPLKAARNQAIRELKAKGVSAEILVELTGLNRGTIFKIAKPKNDEPQFLREEMEGLTKAFESFRNTLVRLLKR